MSCRIYRARMTGRVRGTPRGREARPINSEIYKITEAYHGGSCGKLCDSGRSRRCIRPQRVKLNYTMDLRLLCRRRDRAEGGGKGRERTMRIFLCANYMRLGDIAAGWLLRDHVDWTWIEIPITRFLVTFVTDNFINANCSCSDTAHLFLRFEMTQSAPRERITSDSLFIDAKLIRYAIIVYW